MTTPSFQHRPPGIRAWLLAATAAAALGTAVVQPAFADDGNDTSKIPAAVIATMPLYADTTVAQPAMMLVPSVEYPTTGAQYPVARYDKNTEYIGYYNHAMCYTYHVGDNDDEKYFEISSEGTIATSTRTETNDDGEEVTVTVNGGAVCDGDTEFSGNFLNWASNSSIDMMRLALTGGDRIIDTEELTVLQRAYLPEGTAPGQDYRCFFNNEGQFLPKYLEMGENEDGGEAKGAVPKVMIDSARAQGSRHIFIGNMGNRIYFGLTRVATSSSSACIEAAKNYVLGTSATRRPGSAFDPERDNGEECAYGMTWRGQGWDANNTPELEDGIKQRRETGRACRPYDEGVNTAYRLWYGNATDGWVTGIFRGQVACTAALFHEENNYERNPKNPPNNPANDWAPHGHGAYAGKVGWKMNTGEQFLPGTLPNRKASPEGSEYNDYKCYWTKDTGLIVDADLIPGGETEQPLNTDGFFYARVKVCDELDKRDYTDSKGADFGYCQKYPKGNIKPTGVVQKYSDTLRLGIFGYVMKKGGAYEDGPFGGVLRAPMKYVGSNTYSPSGHLLRNDNPGAEWDPDTGIFKTDPEGLYKPGANTTGILLSDTLKESDDEKVKVSGVINYINQFGRTNPEHKGIYKAHDPVTELYYEALRYMQGLGPTEEAVKGIDKKGWNEYQADGYPLYTSWEGLDPFDAELGYSKNKDYTCMKASMVVIGDVNTHDTVNKKNGNLRLTMNDKDTSKNAFNIGDARAAVRNMERNWDGGYYDANGVKRKTCNPHPSGELMANTTFNSNHTTRNLFSYLPAVSYWAHTHDIRGTNWTVNSTDSKGRSKVRPGLRVTSYFFDVNESNAQYQYDVRAGRKPITQLGEEVTSSTPEWNQHWGNSFWLAAKYGGYKTQGSEYTPGDNSPNAYSTSGNPFYEDCPPTGCINGCNGGGLQYGAPNDYIWSDKKKAQGGNTDGKANPEPYTYYMPSNGRGVIQAFDAIFGDQDMPSNRSIGGAATSGGLADSSFQATFEGDYWSGGLISEHFVKEESVDADGKTVYTWKSVQDWNAASVLETELEAGKVRNIYMGIRDDTTKTTSAFIFDTDNTPDVVKDALKLSSDSDSTSYAFADKRINWLRGDRSEEGTLLRTRNPHSVLGDILGSGVKFVGAPAGQVNLGEGYDAFVNEQEHRTSAVYVGANDGMLHAFQAGAWTQDEDGNWVVDEDGSTGSELFAYIPSWMKNRLAALTQPDYAHKHYVDATPVIGDAKLRPTVKNDDGEVEDSGWSSVLVGGTGGGGRGVYALDVTDPTAFDADKLLWEFTDKDDPDMGYVLGQSRIVKLYFDDEEDSSTTPATTKKVYRWFAMVPGGVNNYAEDDVVRTGGNGDANIFLLALDKPATDPWVEGTNYWKLQLPRNKALESGDTEGKYPSGLLNLEAFTGLGGVTEYVYAGDLHGQLWALSFKDVPHIDDRGGNFWTSDILANNYVLSGKIAPLFVATNKNGKPQPITVAPTIMQGEGNGQHFVSFGTGKYFENDDTKVDRYDSFYTIYSNFKSPGNCRNNANTCIKSRGESATAIIPSRSYLQQVTKDDGSSTEDESYFKPAEDFYWGWIKTPADADATGTRIRSGWFYDFTEDREREVSDASWIPQTSRLMFSSLTPKDTHGDSSVCGKNSGTSRLYTFDMVSGKGVGRVSTVGLLSQPLVFFDEPTETKADSTGRRLRISPVFSGQFGTQGSGAEKVDTVIVPFGRLSWRRIDNFQELRRKANSSGGSGGSSGG